MLTDLFNSPEKIIGCISIVLVVCAGVTIWLMLNGIDNNQDNNLSL